jgi:hypothetical protein
MLCLRDGSRFKREGAGQLRILPMMSWQLTPLVTSHDRIKIGQPPWLLQRIMGLGPIGRDVAARGQVVLRSSPRGSKSQGAGHRRAAAWWSPARSVLEPVRPKTAGDILQDLTSGPTTSRPNEESWDFDGNKLTSARIRTRRSPLQNHETSPVSGASVMGMTYEACQGPSYLPAGVPGVSTALGWEDRLRSKGWLRQQPAGDSTEESQSWAMKTRALQRLFHRKWPVPDKIDKGEGRE